MKCACVYVGLDSQLFAFDDDDCLVASENFIGTQLDFENLLLFLSMLSIYTMLSAHIRIAHIPWLIL